MKTAEQRYKEVRELTDGFKNKTMLRHHLIRMFQEAMDEGRSGETTPVVPHDEAEERQEDSAV